MGDFLEDHLVEGEEVIFDKRHSLWDIWKNFIIGAGSIMALVLLLTKFKPGVGDSTGYVVLISILAAFFLLYYGAYPAFKRRFLNDVYEGSDFVVPFLVMLVVVGAWAALMWFRNSEGFADIWATLAWVAFFVVILGWLVYPMLRWYFQHFILTDRRLILHEGIINKRSIDLPLEKVNDIKFKQNLFERIFRYGDLVIESAGEYGQQPFTNIGDPEKIKQLIVGQRDLSEDEQARRRGRDLAQDIARSMRAGSTSTAAQPVPQAVQRPEFKADELEVVEGLKKLADLHQQGALTDEEFQRAKEELLERMEND
ncbi:MAG: PH domain-containing protein [Actinomycetota bacterium]|nr:PH domain-containing protein [Actinomycetota bacterium]